MNFITVIHLALARALVFWAALVSFCFFRYSPAVRSLHFPGTKRLKSASRHLLCASVTVICIARLVMAGPLLFFLLAGSICHAGTGDVSQKDLAAGIKTTVIGNSPWEEDQVEVSIVSISPQNALPLKGSIDRISYSGSPISYSGRKNFSVFLTGVEGRKTRLHISTDLEIFETVVIATRSLRPSRVVKPEDVFLARRKTTGDSLYSLDEVIGKRVKRPVRANSIIKREVLEFPVIIEKNDRVTLLFERGGLRISTVGIAKENGKQGKVIGVMNVDSGKTVYGEVKDSQTILVGR